MNNTLQKEIGRPKIFSRVDCSFEFGSSETPNVAFRAGIAQINAINRIQIASIFLLFINKTSPMATQNTNENLVAAVKIIKGNSCMQAIFVFNFNSFNKITE